MLSGGCPVCLLHWLLLRGGVRVHFGYVCPVKIVRKLNVSKRVNESVFGLGAVGLFCVREWCEYSRYVLLFNCL